MIVRIRYAFTYIKMLQDKLYYILTTYRTELRSGVLH